VGVIAGVLVTVFETTARHRADAELAELVSRLQDAHAAAERGRHKLYSTFMQAPVAICILEGPLHTFTFANPLYRALVGGRDIVGKSLLEALPDLREGGFDKIMDRVQATGEAHFGKEVPLKLPHHGPDESLIVNFVYQPMRIAGDAIDGILAAVIDVTELVQSRRRIEVLAEQVRASEAAWRLVTDALPLLVSFVTPDERYGLVNKAYEDWFGVRREDLLGRPVREVIGEAAYAVLGSNVRRGLAGERLDFERHDVPYRLGGTRDVKGKFVPHRDGAGAPAGYTAVLEDVTEQRRLEKERARLSRQRTEVLDAMGDAFLALDSEWRILQFNRELEAITGKGAHELAGRDLRDVYPELRNPESESRKGYERCMVERSPVTFTTYSELRGAWFEVRAYATGEGGISIFYRDVSAEKKTEEALRKKTDFERQLIGIVSHDLRNPLNVVLMASKWLRRQEDLSPASTKHVVRIENAGERAMRLIRDLLDFTQAELGGGIRIERRPTNLHDLTAAVLEEIQATHPDRVLEVQSAGDGSGEWDPDRLSQVIQNLVTNALKYSPAGSTVTVATYDDGPAVTLVVNNLGPSIPPEAVPTMFGPFERGAVRSDAFRSVGLGLYIVEKVVKAHGGTVVVESNDQDGTTFTVVLPRIAPTREGSRLELQEG
jgi:PAS domain S-box-containing protein